MFILWELLRRTFDVNVQDAVDTFQVKHICPRIIVPLQTRHFLEGQVCLWKVVCIAPELYTIVNCENINWNGHNYCANDGSLYITAYEHIETLYVFKPIHIVHSKSVHMLGSVSSEVLYATFVTCNWAYVVKRNNLQIALYIRLCRLFGLK